MIPNNKLKLNRHVFYLSLDMSEIFKNDYFESSFRVIPLEFSGTLNFYSFPNKVSASITGKYFLDVPRMYDHAKGVVNEIGSIKIDKMFIDSLWSCHWIGEQVKTLYRTLVTEKSEQYQLMEEF